MTGYRTVRRSWQQLGRGRTYVLQEAEQFGAEMRRQQLVSLVQHQQPRPVRLQGTPQHSFMVWTDSTTRDCKKECQ